MTPLGPDPHPRRRWGALLVLGLGLALAVTQLGGSTPQEQTLLFRLPTRSDARTSRLDAQFTPVGQLEPVRGLTLSLDSPPPRELRQPVRLLAGDYIVAVKLTWEHAAGPFAPVKTETRGVHRVRLRGLETLVALDAKGPD